MIETIRGTKGAALALALIACATSGGKDAQRTEGVAMQPAGTEADGGTPEIATKPVAQEATPEERAAQRGAGGAPTKVTTVEGITEYRLANGLRVLLFPDETKQTITVNVTYLVGSRHEGYGETGMAHLLEHLVFKGTDKHPNIPQELTSHGARPNGTTSFDRTNYFETFNATDENLSWALELESDRMVNSHIAKKDLDSEMTVVRNEFESGENSPSGVLIKRILAVMFDWHNYGKLPIGARSDIESVPIERLKAFYTRFYQPDNAVLTVAGRVDEAKTLALIDKTFGAVPRPSRTLISTYTREPAQDGERTVTLRRVGDLQLAVAAHHIPSANADEAAAVEVLAYALGNQPAGRLHKSLVETGKASSVFGFNFALAEPGVFLTGVELRKEQSLEGARKILLDTIDQLGQHPITADEVERAKTNLLKGITLTMNQAEVLGLRLSEYIGQGDWRLFFLHRDRLRKVTAAEVNQVAAAYLLPSNRTIGEFIPSETPKRAEIAEAPKPADLLNGYTGDKAMTQGEAFDPAPANIESRTKRQELSGLKVAMLPKKTRGGTVVATMNVHYGDVESLHGKAAVGDMAIDMLMRGTKKHTRQQISDTFDKLKARVGISGGAGQLSGRLETTRENFAAAYRLFAEVLREPAFPKAEFDQLRTENLAQIEEQRSDPGSMANTTFGQHLNPYPPGDPRHVDSPEEGIAEYKAATLEQVRAFHADMFGASRVELALVGDFDEKEAAALVTELFGDWKSKRPFTRVPQPFVSSAALVKNLEAPDKANAVMVAGETLKVRDDSPDYPALVLGNYMLGGGFLNSRLAVRIRQKEGLSYGVGSQLSASSLDESGTFQVFAIHAPQNTQKLEAAMREEVQRMLDSGFTADEVAAAKSGWLQSRKVQRAQDAGLAGLLARELYLGRTLAWDQAIDEKVSALKAEEIGPTMRKYIDPARLTVVRAGDFAKAAATKAK